MLDAWERFIEGGPKPHGTVPDSNFRGDGQSAAFEVRQQLVPALHTFLKNDLEADQLFPALRCHANDHQHAFSVFFHPRLQIHAVRPDIDVVSS